MTPLWIDLLGAAWKIAAAFVLCSAIVAIWAGVGDEYSGAPAEAGDEQDEDEKLPEDPDRERDWGIADRMGAL